MSGDIQFNGKATFEIEDGRIRVDVDFGQRCHVKAEYDGKGMSGDMWRAFAMMGIKVTELAQAQALAADHNDLEERRKRQQADLDTLSAIGRGGGISVPSLLQEAAAASDRAKAALAEVGAAPPDEPSTP